jgi:hypothetical protein
MSVSDWILFAAGTAAVAAVGAYFEVQRLHRRLDWYFEQYLKRNGGGLG